MKSIFRVAVIGAVLMMAAQTSAQNTEVSRATMVGLTGVSVYVDSLAQHLVDRGMTEDVFSVEVERCLKEHGVVVLNPAAGETEPGNPVLYLGVTTVFEEGIERCQYGIRLELTQTARLERDPGHAVFHVPTWSVGGIGIYQVGWRDALIDDVLGFTEEFIEAFYQANPLLKPEPGDSTATERLMDDGLD